MFIGKSNAAWLLNGLTVTAAAPATGDFFGIDYLLQISAEATGGLNFMNSLWIIH